MISKDKTYRTRDGREVRIYATDGGGYWPIQGAFALSSGGWHMAAWDNEGNAVALSGYYSLIEVRPRHKRTVWLNVYPELISCYLSKEHADSRANRANINRTACIKVELDFAEGDGL